MVALGVTGSPYFSIIIPTYNSAQTIELLLDSISKSSCENFEVIVVDDGSIDDTERIVGSSQYPISSFQFVKQKHKGAGAARNLGAKKAKGKVLVFADSDIIFSENILSELAKNFKDKKTKAVVGVYDKAPANPGFFTNFKALRDYSYIMLERDPKYPIGGFGGWISAIRTKLFNDLGGFDESYKGAGMEDYEFAWRLIKRVSIIFDPKIRVKHHFADFWSTVKNFYKRSYLWTNLYFKHRRFFSSATNPREAFVAGLSNLSTILLLFFIFTSSIKVFLSFLIIFSARLYLGRIFLLFVAREKGVLFSLITIPISHALYAAVYLGVARSLVSNFSKMLLEWLNPKRTKNIGDTILPFLPDGKRILDLGTGSGKIAEYLKTKTGKDFVLADVFDYTDGARKIVIYDGTTLPFKDNYFDGVLIIFVLHHAKDATQILKEAARVSKSKIIVMEDMANNLPQAFLAKGWDILVNSVVGGNWDKLEFKSDRQWRAIFRKLGTRIVSEKDLRLPFYRLTKQKLYILEKK